MLINYRTGKLDPKLKDDLDNKRINDDLQYLKTPSEENVCKDKFLEHSKTQCKWGYNCSRVHCTYDLAARFGHIGTIKYLHEFPPYILQETETTNENVDVIPFKPCSDNAMYTAVIEGQLNIVKYLYEVVKVPYDTIFMFYASSRGHMEIIKYFCKFHKDEPFLSANNNFCDLDTIKYLYEELHVKFTSNTMICAIETGYLDIVKYLNEIVNIPYQTDFMDSAIFKDNIDIVKYFYYTESGGCTEKNIKYIKNDEIKQFLLKVYGEKCYGKGIGCGNSLVKYAGYK